MTNRTRGARRLFGLAAVVALLATACSGDDSAVTTTVPVTDAASTVPPETEPPATEPPETEPPETEPPATEPPETEPPETEPPRQILRILVTNDDGVKAEGMDAVVRALLELDDVEITVVAPLGNQSGSGDRLSDEPPAVTEDTTLGGYPALAVAGYPADAVVHALSDGVLAEWPHLLVSGLNEGQNIGPAWSLSGTVGTARTSVRLGVPGLATSQQAFATEPDYETGGRYVAAWVTEHRDAILAGEIVVQTYNLNVPSCDEGEPRGVIEVPILADLGGRDYVAPAVCVGDVAEPDNDVDGIAAGYVTLSTIPPD